jgi:hypothetical protein
VVVFACALLSTFLAAQGEDPDRPVWFRVQLEAMKRDLPRLAAEGYDIAGTDRAARTADVVGTVADLERLAAAGLKVEVLRYLDGPALEVDSAYTDYGEMKAYMATLESLYPGIARVMELGITEGGRAYQVMKISDNVMVDEDEPAIFFDFQHHSREVMTPEIARDLMDYLLSNYGSDPQVTDWVDRTEIWVLPIHNPDGSNHVFTVDDSWRKNRRNNGDGSWGVDLNRNYDWRWGACNGSSGATSSQAYRGPAPESEPETVAITDLARQERPVIDLSYHTYGELVLYPYGCTNAIPSDREAVENLGHQIARRLVSDSGSGTYEAGYSWSLLGVVDGETKSWMLGELGTFSYTVEANASSSGGFYPSYAAWRDSTVARSRPGWQHALDRLDGPSVRGHVRDACTGDPLEAEVAIDELPPALYEQPRTSEPAHGRYQRLLLLGDYTLRVSKTGYHEQAHPVAVRTAAVDREVDLVPVGSHGLVAGGILVDDSLSGDGDGILDPGETARLRVAARATGEAVTGITATLGSTDPFLSILDPSAGYPDLAGGASSLPSDDGFQVTADPVTPADHVATVLVFFSAADALCQPPRFTELPISARREGCSLVEPLDIDPGWTIVNSDPTGWAFGQPTALAFGHGPGSGATGQNVYGTNLTGNYGNAGDHLLTLPTLDLSHFTGSELDLQRWISTEEGFDFASVEGSADGVTWDLLWTGTASDRGWRRAHIDLSALDGEPAALVRFRMKSDYSVTDGGFYLDDVEVCGTLAAAPAVAGLAVLDDTANTACTDADGVPDAGEVVSLGLTVENRGVGPALGAMVQVTSSTPSLEVLTPAVDLGDIPAGGQVQAVLTARIDGAAACGEEATLLAAFTTNGGFPFSGPDQALVLELDGGGCDANDCPAACAPTAAVQGLMLNASGALSWGGSLDACHAVAGLGYRVYRAASAVPSTMPPASFPEDTGFVDVTLADADGSLLDPGFQDGWNPGPGGIGFYLVADVGTDGEPGPVGHYGD